MTLDKDYYHTLDKDTVWCLVCGLSYPIRLVDDLHSIYMCYNCGHRDVFDLFLEEPWYDVLYIYAPRPKVKPCTTIEIPDNYLIFNAYRQLLGSYVRNENAPFLPCYLRWEGEFFNGKFYAAVSVFDHDYIESNVKNGAVLLKYVNDEDVMAWAKEYYAEYEDNMADYSPREMARKYICYMNRRVQHG